jgi:hypothetical protein
MHKAAIWTANNICITSSRGLCAGRHSTAHEPSIKVLWRAHELQLFMDKRRASTCSWDTVPSFSRGCECRRHNASARSIFELDLSSNNMSVFRAAI